MFSNATKKRFLLITFLLGTGLLATSTLAAENQGPQLLTGGQIHLPQHDQPLSVSLKGEWELYWGSFLYTDAMNIQALRPCLISIPHTPSQSASNCPQIERYGYGTLRASIFFDSNESQSANNTYFLRIPDIPGAWRIWINGELRGSAGRIGKTRRATKPQYLIEFFEITPVDSRIEIVIEYANFHDYRASITQSPTLSSRRPFEISFFYNNFFLMLINGAFLFLFVYFMILFILDRSYKENLYFALFVFCLLFRQIIMGQEMMSIVMHPVPWRLKFAIWHIMIPMQLLTFNNFIHSLFPRESRPEVGRVLFWFAMIYAVFCLVTPASIFARTLSIPQAVAVIYGIYVHVVIIMAIIRQRDRAWILILGSLVMFAAVIHDIAFSRGLVQTGRLLNVGALVFVLFQTNLLTRRYTINVKTTTLLTRRLAQINAIYSRFVPDDLAEILKKDSINDIMPGDYRRQEVCAMILDVRRFTPISESLSASETFNFINTFLQTAAPIIRTSEGFITGFAGDQIRAIFKTAPSGLDAAIKIQRSLTQLNIERESKGLPLINAGIGLSWGEAIISAVGSTERLQLTSIGSVIERSTALETLSKHTGSKILCDQDCMEQCGEISRLSSRMLGSFRFNNKEARMVYEMIYSFMPNHQIKKLETKYTFEKALQQLADFNPQEAEALFSAVLEENPDDEMASYYLSENSSAHGGLEGLYA